MQNLVAAIGGALAGTMIVASAIAAAQAPALVEPTKPMVVLSELDVAEIQQVVLANVVKDTKYQLLTQQEAFKEYRQALESFTAIKARIDSRLETRHPGYTYDWIKGSMIAKPPPAEK